MDMTMPTLADRGDLAPRARHLLAQQLAECGALLEPLLRNVLDDLEHELFRIAEQSSGGQTQHEAMESLRELKRTRPRFQGKLMALLERRFANVGQPQADTAREYEHRNGEGLALVDPHEFDESMALDDLSARTELHAGNAIFDLCHRYAVLLAAPPLDNDALPSGPHMLAVVLGEAAGDLGLQREQRLLFYRLCDRRLFGAAESFYGRLNDHLKSSGILPDLRSYLPKRAGSTTRPAQAETPAPAAGAPQTPASNAPAPIAPAPIAPVTNFTAPPPGMGELHSLLDARRHALYPEAEAAAAQSAQFASMPELQEALAALQAMPSRKPGPQTGETLNNNLMAELRRSAHGGPVQLQPEHRDAMDLVGLLYDQLLAETRDQGIAQQLLASLQVPLLRIALSDSDFFTTRNHPARRLLNLVLETANLWLDRSGDHFDAALNQRLQRSVQRVAAEYRGDIGVVEREADDLDSHLRLISRRAEIAERRQVEAAQGRDRLREARATASAAVAKRLAGRKTTPLVRALLENAWTDALTITLLREGENSEAYRRRLAAADQLLGSPMERDDTRLAADFNHGLTQVGLQASEADQITRYALDLPQQRPASPTVPPPPSQTELLIRLKSRRKSDDEETSPAAEAVARKLALTPSERRALDSLKKLPFGSWLEFTINQQGQKAARKLAWYAPTSGRCLLVNARGAAAPERTLDQVARLMARGQVSVIPRQDGGMIDRAWNALVAGLRKFGRSNETSETAT
ncbi:MAG: hypothetical protein OJF55_001708 [Rhodanobacteraceae bacterium]|jgi:hypothetical protein|nr:MAG: hypothetical protein OJF55_001708 [Rhodanobacteraceae bacterium]